MSDNENHNLPAEVLLDAEKLIPQASESFRPVSHPSETFQSIPKALERKENHILTVRDAARMFEAAGVARTERSITNWCQSNRTGVARLDAYFDPNERKYFITLQSVDLAIAEEKARAAKVNEQPEPFGTILQGSEPFRTVPHDGERMESSFPNNSESRVINELQNQIRDLQITNRAKDMVIEKFEKRRMPFEQVINANRKVGELMARLLQLGGEDKQNNAIQVLRL